MSKSNVASILKKAQQQLFASHQFKNSKQNQDLLNYLIDCTINKTPPKETAIAIHVFNKDASFHPGEDPLVRVYIHNLKKKLKDYYQNEGKNDKYKLIIPRGAYTIQIVSSEKKQNQIKSIVKYPAIVSFKTSSLFLSLLCLYLLFTVFRLDKKLGHFQIVDDSDPIWGEYMNPNDDVVVVLGDHFFYTTDIPYDMRSVQIRDTWIDSRTELSDRFFFPKEYKVKPSKQTYFPDVSVFGLTGIITLLNSIDNRKIYRSSSSLTATIIEENNIIYLGSFKCLEFLSHYLEQARFSFDNRNRTLVYSDSINQVTFATGGTRDIFNKDYVLIIKTHGPNGRAILLIASYFAIGTKEATRNLAEPELLAQLQKQLSMKFGYIPSDFAMLFEVYGFKDAITESNSKLIKVLDTSQQNFPQKKNKSKN